MNELDALAAAESAPDRDTDDGPGQRGACGPVFASAPPPAINFLVFAGQGKELLSQFEEAIITEARARPGACSQAMVKAVELIGEPAGSGGPAESITREPEVLVEEALLHALACLEDTLLLRARAARASDWDGAASREAIARAHQALRLADAPRTGRSERVSLKTGTRTTPLKRPLSAPLVHMPAQDCGSDLRIRQRSYDDRRAERVRTPQHPVVAPKVFDAYATCNHCFKPVRVRRDENGRLQPQQLSNRLARMCVPTFLGLPLVRATSRPAPCTNPDFFFERAAR